MNGSPINGPRGGVDMRDVAAIHARLDALEATLGARAANEALIRQETRSWMVRSENRTLELLARLGVPIPEPERETLSPPTWRGRMTAWLARPASTRALLYGLAVAGIGATLAQPLARVLLLGSP